MFGSIEGVEVGVSSQCTTSGCIRLCLILYTGSLRLISNFTRSYVSRTKSVELVLCFFARVCSYNQDPAILVGVHKSIYTFE